MCSANGQAGVPLFFKYVGSITKTPRICNPRGGYFQKNSFFLTLSFFLISLLTISTAMLNIPQERAA